MIGREKGKWIPGEDLSREKKKSHWEGRGTINAKHVRIFSRSSWGGKKETAPPYPDEGPTLGGEKGKSSGRERR